MGRNKCGKSKGFFVSYCWCCCCSYGHGSSRSRRRRRDLPPPPRRPSLCVSACCFVSSNATMEIINRIDALCSFFTLSFPFFPAASPKEGPPTNLRTALSPFLPILFTLSLSLSAAEDWGRCVGPAANHRPPSRASLSILAKISLLMVSLLTARG